MRRWTSSIPLAHRAASNTSTLSPAKPSPHPLANVDSFYPNLYATVVLAIAGNADRYGSLTSRRTKIDTELQALSADRSQRNVRQSELRNLSEGWDNWVELNDCDSRLKNLPAYEHFPDDAITWLEAFQERVRTARTDAEEAAERLRSATEAAATVIPDGTLLEAADRVEEIRRGRDGFDGSVHDLPERLLELRELEANFVTRVADLGRPWDESDLEAFDTSLGVRIQVEAWKERLNQSGEGLRQAELRLEQERGTFLDRQLETQEAGEQFPAEPPSLDAAALMGQQDALRAVRSCLAEYERQRQNHANLRGQLNVLTPASARGSNAVPLPALALVLVALLGLALAGTGIFLGGQALPLGVAGVLVLIIVSIVLWFSSRSGHSLESSPVTSALGRHTEEAEKAMDLSRQALLYAAATLNLPEQPDGATLDPVEARLDSIRTQTIAWNAGKNRLEEASRRERSQEQRFADAVQAHEGAAASQQEAQEEWQQWLRERQLDETLTSEGKPPSSLTWIRSWASWEKPAA